MKNLKAHFERLGTKQPLYQGELPKGNDGLGLMFLGTTAEPFLDKEFTIKLKLKH